MARRQKFTIDELTTKTIKNLVHGGYTQFGEDGTGIDVYFRGDTTSSSAMWDQSGDIMIFDGADLRLQDSDHLYLGDANDVDIRWDGTDLDILPLADNQVMKFGATGLGWDVWLYGTTSDATIKLDNSANMFTFDAIDLHLNDSDILEFGDKSGGDVSIRWDGTDLDVLAGSDDYIIKFGTGTNSFDMWWYGNTASDTMVLDAGAKTMTLDGIDFILKDGDMLEFGDKSAGDVIMQWDGTDFTVTAGSDDRIIKFGNGTNNFDVWLYGTSASQNIKVDAGSSKVLLTGEMIEWVSGKAANAVMKFADDSGATCADLASAVGTLSGVVKVKLGTGTKYIPLYTYYTAT